MALSLETLLPLPFPLTLPGASSSSIATHVMLPALCASTISAAAQVSKELTSSRSVLVSWKKRECYRPWWICMLPTGVSVLCPGLCVCFFFFFRSGGHFFWKDETPHRSARANQSLLPVNSSCIPVSRWKDHSRDKIPMVKLSFFFLEK